MGALSTYFNYNCYPYQPIQTTNNSEIITFQHHEQEQFVQQNHHFPSNYFNETSLLDESFIFQTPCFYSNETYPNPCQDQLLVDSTFSSQNDSFVSMNEIFPNEEDFTNYLTCPKRQKLCYEEKREEPQQELLNSPNFFVDEFMTNPFAASKIVDVVQCEKKVTEKTISPQSIAARERRRKITEKTQELGKLVPGGPKMNTAEMLNAAANYVKFLQAQVGMLQLMETFSKVIVFVFYCCNVLILLELIFEVNYLFCVLRSYLTLQVNLMLFCFLCYCMLLDLVFEFIIPRVCFFIAYLVTLCENPCL